MAIFTHETETSTQAKLLEIEYAREHKGLKFSNTMPKFETAKLYLALSLDFGDVYYFQDRKDENLYYYYVR